VVFPSFFLFIPYYSTVVRLVLFFYKSFKRGSFNKHFLNSFNFTSEALAFFLGDCLHTVVPSQFLIPGVIAGASSWKHNVIRIHAGKTLISIGHKFTTILLKPDHGTYGVVGVMLALEKYYAQDDFTLGSYSDRF